MKKVWWIIFIFNLVGTAILVGKNGFLYRRIKLSNEYWQNLQRQIGEIDFNTIPALDLTTYFFKDEVFRYVNKWKQTKVVDGNDLSSLVTIAKVLGISEKEVKEGLASKESFMQLVDKIVTSSFEELISLIRRGDERYYEVIRYISFPVLPYLEKLYSQRITDDSEDAVQERIVIMKMILQDTVSSSSDLAEFWWSIVTSDNNNISEKEKTIAIEEIGYCGDFEMFTALLKYLGNSEALGVNRVEFDKAVNTMAERLLTDKFDNPSQFAAMVREKKKVLLRTKSGNFVEVVDFHRTWIPGLWLVVTSEPKDAFITPWEDFKSNLAVLVDWSVVRDYLPFLK